MAHRLDREAQETLKEIGQRTESYMLTRIAVKREIKKDLERSFFEHLTEEDPSLYLEADKNQHNTCYVHHKKSNGLPIAAITFKDGYCDKLDLYDSEKNHDILNELIKKIDGHLHQK